MGEHKGVIVQGVKAQASSATVKAKHLWKGQIKHTSRRVKTKQLLEASNKIISARVKPKTPLEEAKHKHSRKSQTKVLLEGSTTKTLLEESKQKAHQVVTLQLLEERDAELERSEAALEGHKQAGDVREAVSTLCSPCFSAKPGCCLQCCSSICMARMLQP